MKESSIHYAKRVIRSPKDAAQLFRDFLGPLDREYFVVLCLNVKNEPTHLNIAHMGSLNSSIVHPCEVFKPAILSNAYSLVNVQLSNHWVLSGYRYVSFKERGMLIMTIIEEK